MKYLIVDGELNGTGIRDKYDEYIEIHKLNLSTELIKIIKQWQQKYEELYFNNFSDQKQIVVLDEEGIKISHLVKSELEENNEVRIEYYSSGKMFKTLIV